MPAQHGFIERLAELSASGVPFVCVTMVEALGSTPQDAGSKMLSNTFGHEKLRLFWPLIGALGQSDFLFAKRFTVRRGCVHLMR